jgi:hypothetical protein
MLSGLHVHSALAEGGSSTGVIGTPERGSVVESGPLRAVLQGVCERMLAFDDSVAA